MGWPFDFLDKEATIDESILVSARDSAQRMARADSPMSRTVAYECCIGGWTDTVRLNFERENRMTQQKVMNRWITVAGAILIQLALGAIYAWSLFTKPLTAAGGGYEFTAGQTAWVFSKGKFDLTALKEDFSDAS